MNEYFVVSGHSTQQQNESGTEEDGQDECKSSAHTLSVVLPQLTTRMAHQIWSPGVEAVYEIT